MQGKGRKIASRQKESSLSGAGKGRAKKEKKAAKADDAPGKKEIERAEQLPCQARSPAVRRSCRALTGIWEISN